MPSLWSSGATPATSPSQAGGITTGTWMFADVDIWITDFRYYRAGEFDVGPHIGRIYSTSGTVLAQATYASEASGFGWRTQALATALQITAGTPFCATIHSATGRYAGTSGGFTAQMDNAPLHGYASASAPGSHGNGVYNASATPTFPISTFGAAAYFTDIVYQTSAPNIGPTANAGVNQSVLSSDVVTLTSAGSTDSDGTISSYIWRQISGNNVTLSSTTAANPTFTAPVVPRSLNLVFGLKVTDDDGAQSSEDTVTIQVSPSAYSRYSLQSGSLTQLEGYRMTGGSLE